MSVLCMSVNYGGRDASPRIWSGDAIENWPQILLCFKTSITKLLVLQCSKKLTNSMTLIDYSLLSKSTSSTSTKSSLQAENPAFFLARTRTKYRSEWTKTCHFNWKIGMWHNTLSKEGYHLTHPTSRPTKPSGSTPASPRIPARFTPMVPYYIILSLSVLNNVYLKLERVKQLRIHYWPSTSAN